MFALFGYAKLGFWWSLLQLKYMFLRFIYLVTPFPTLKNKIIEGFEKLGVKVTCKPDEIGRYDRSKYKVEIAVHDKRFFYKVFDSTLGIGEAYMDGWIDCDNIAELFHCFSKIQMRHGKNLYNRVALARNRQGVKESKGVIDIHYNLGNDLYENMLDKGMSYTCGLWYPETKTLEEAQINKIDTVARKLKLKPGMKVLDLGGGFGAAAKYMAQNYGVSVTVYNISKEQVKYGRESCKDVDVTFVLADYRTATGQFDAVYSIGIFEHVGIQNHRGYFELVNRCLKPEGIALTHTIIAADYQNRAGGWIDKYIFPGGELPYLNDLMTNSMEILVTEDVQSFAKSYAKTLHCWHDNFKKNWDSIKGNYENMMDGRFYRVWVWYLGCCEGGFLGRALQLIQVVHTKYHREEEYHSVRDKRV